MNQPKVKIKYQKCLECNNKIAVRYFYDRHVSDWVCNEIPLCDECESRLRGEEGMSKKIISMHTDEEIEKSFIEDVEAVEDQLPEPRCICCGDDRFKIIAMAKEDILKSTNIDSSPDEMKVLDNILFRCWQMGWLDGYKVN